MTIQITQGPAISLSIAFLGGVGALIGWVYKLGRDKRNDTIQARDAVIQAKDSEISSLKAQIKSPTESLAAIQLLKAENGVLEESLDKQKVVLQKQLAEGDAQRRAEAEKLLGELKLAQERIQKKDSEYSALQEKYSAIQQQYDSVMAEKKAADGELDIAKPSPLLSAMYGAMFDPQGLGGMADCFKVPAAIAAAMDSSKFIEAVTAFDGLSKAVLKSMPDYSKVLGITSATSISVDKPKREDTP